MLESDSEVERRPSIVIEVGDSSEASSIQQSTSPEPAKLFVRSTRRSTSRTASPATEDDIPLAKGGAARSSKGILTPSDLSPDDEVTNIKSRVKMAGLGACYVVKMKRRGWVRVTEEVLSEYTDLVEDFEHDNPRPEASTDDEEEVKEADWQDGQTNPDASEDESEEEDSDEDMGRRRRTRSRPKKAPARAGRSLRVIAEPTRRSSRATRHQAAFEDEEEAVRGIDNGARRADSSDDDDSSEVEVVKRSRPVSNKPLLNLKTKNVEDEDEDVLSPVDKHKVYCVKCSELPAYALLEQFQRKGKKRRQGDPDKEDITGKGAWIECGVCSNAYHFTCLPKTLQADVSRTVKAEDVAESHHSIVLDASENTTVRVVRSYKEMDIDQTLTIPLCPGCARSHGTQCAYCHQEHPSTIKSEQDEKPKVEEDAVMADAKPLTKTDSVITTVPSSFNSKSLDLPEAPPAGQLFRCVKCFRAAHYACMPANPQDDEDSDADEETQANARADYYQRDWQCPDCDRWTAKVDVILAWKPLGAKETDTIPQDIERPVVKDFTFPAEYLVKFQDDSYRHLEWVPHAFMAASHPSRLRNFLKDGSEMVEKVRRRDASEADGDDTPDLEIDVRAFGRAPNASAENDIPVDWFTVERILAVEFSGGKKKVAEDPEESIERVERALIKWKSLPYSEATWDSFSPDDIDYPSFQQAYLRWLDEKDVVIPRLTAAQMVKISQPRTGKFEQVKDQPDYIGGPKKLKLMDFQMLGVNWMLYKWWQRKNGVLSDEMGLGKTVQVITALSILYKQEQARPFLIVVPNSTIANWVREFETWAPADMRVVAYFGSAASRHVCSTHDLFTPGASPMLRAHVILVTYESVTNDISTFRKVQRYDTLIVDEAQRLKAGATGHLFKALQSLNIGSKFLLTGTPLNNSVAEILNLMYFLDEEEFDDLKQRQQYFEDLTAGKVQELQDLLKPYFLRRRKEEVLDLPPLVETIVPVSLRPLQKKFYKTVLSKNLAGMDSIFRTSKNAKGARIGGLNNVLMQLRKICQSPYLFADDIEPAGLSPDDSHAFLVDASAKVTLLAKLLPKLFAKDHRVLIFSQFLGVLDLLARFLEHLDIPFTSLSGSSSQSERQDAIDAFNAPKSKLKVFLLSTRAGGVGINLTTADTVILFDQDFNPMQDLQAISRAHRIGQTKPVTCYKLLVKGSCEEKILLASKKKLALEHVIVSRMSQEETETADVEATLQFGAKAIFEAGDGESASDIKYSDADVDNLIANTDNEIAAAQKAGKSGKEAAEINKVFSFAKIWENEVNANETANDNVDEQRSFWGKLLQEQQLEQEQLKRQREANMGRGRRERKQIMDLALLVDEVGDSPQKEDRDKKRRKTSSEAGSDYDGKASEDSDAAMSDAANEPSLQANDIRKELGEMDNNSKKILMDAQAEKERQKKKERQRKRAAEVERIRASMLKQPNSPNNADVLAHLDHSFHNAPLPFGAATLPSPTRVHYSKPKVPKSPSLNFGKKPSAPSPRRPVFPTAEDGHYIPTTPSKQTLGRMADAPIPRSPDESVAFRVQLLERVERKTMRTGDPSLIAQFQAARSLKGSEQVNALKTVFALVKQHTQQQYAGPSVPKKREVIEID